MSNNHSDDDVIVISEDEARYETRDENAPVDPADDDELAASDQATQAVPSEAGRYGSMTSPGAAAASDASDLDEHGLDEHGLDVDADPDTHPVTEPVTLVSSSDGTGAEAPGYSGTLAADGADSAASDTLGSDTLGSDTLASDTLASDTGTSDTGTVNGSGSVIPMPGSSAPAASATPAAAPAVGATPDSNWPQIQSLFVDDPLAAVQQAADVVGGALAALTAAANNREQTLRGGWQGDGTGTEELRTALREYRDLAGRLSTLAKDL